MNGREVHESWGHPPRIGHNYEILVFDWWKLAWLWGSFTSIAGHVWLGYLAGQLLGAW